MNLRPYQSEAVDATWEHVRNRDDAPCIVLPTGTGKSLVIAKLASDAIAWGGRVLVLAHVKELLEQNAAKIAALCPTIKVGIYSAGLGRREANTQIVVAGIQSAYRKACEMGKFDVVIIDEAHLIPPDGDGMYQTFLNDARIVNPFIRLIGLTATPYRLKGGLICKDENLLNQVCYEAGLREMIMQGWLAPLVSRRGAARADMSQVSVRAGEFAENEMAAAMDKVELVDAACREIVQLTAARKSILIFAASVEHAGHVQDAIQRFANQPAALIHGETPTQERADILARFKGESAVDLFGVHAEPVRWLVNVNVLTTGFDAPGVDCVVILRATMSPGLLVQMIGRGTRLSPTTGKTDCLVLDYGDNLMRHGPVDMIRTPDDKATKKANGEPGEAPAKECPACHAVVALAFAVCPQCGEAFPPPVKKVHAPTAATTAVMSGEVQDDIEQVDGVRYAVHHKKNAPEGTPLTMRVEYQFGMRFQSEWVCPEHAAGSFARTKFIAWWMDRTTLPPPTSAHEAVGLAENGALADCKQVTVRTVSGDKFPRLVNHVLGPKPDPAPFLAAIESEPSGWQEPEDEYAEMRKNYATTMATDNDDDIPF